MALPRQLRLRGYRAFDHLHRRGRRFQGDLLTLRTAEGDPCLLSPPLDRLPASLCRCSVVVSAKVSKRAVRRNRLRRLLHEWLRRACAGVPEQRRGTWVLLSLKPASLDAPPERLLGECDLLFQKAGLCP